MAHFSRLLIRGLFYLYSYTHREWGTGRIVVFSLCKCSVHAVSTSDARALETVWG